MRQRAQARLITLATVSQDGHCRGRYGSHGFGELPRFLPAPHGAVSSPQGREGWQTSSSCCCGARGSRERPKTVPHGELFGGNRQRWDRHGAYEELGGHL